MADFWVEVAAEAAGEMAPSGTGAETLRDRNVTLERRVERLNLVCQALWTLCRDRLKFTEDDLARRVQDLDLADGRLDGRVAPGIECASCKRVFSRRRRLCLYCGTTRKDVSPFDAV